MTRPSRGIGKAFFSDQTIDRYSSAGLSNSLHAVRRTHEGRHRAASRLTLEKTMPQYLVAGYLPDDFDPSQMDPSVGEEIHALNKEMIAAGVRKFACGLGAANSLRGQADGGVLVTDGPYLEAKEHIGGFWILECADMDEAMRWARKGVAATRGQVEVREIFFAPSPD
jgi:hypothetical protein